MDPSQNTDTEGSRDLIDLLAEDFVSRLQLGESPTVAEYIEKHPELESEIRDVFPALQMMEQARPNDDTMAATRPRNLKSKERIGDYEIIRKIGQGGMGVVYQARQQSLNRRVALKILPPNVSSDEVFIERFRREAQAAAKLHHTNIVPVFEVGQDGDTIYYAMQFIDGRPLDQIQKEVIKLNEQEPSEAGKSSISELIAGSASTSTGSQTQLHYFKAIAGLGACVADALGFAHERSIIHRDVKPSNLLLDNQGVIWLADFGLAKTGDSDLTETGDFLGTARYMSPERFKGQGDHRGDIYGLGVTLYELVALRRAFTADDRFNLIEQIANQEPTRPSEINRKIPLDLETIILKSMDKDPRRRYQNALEMADDLRRFVDDQPIRARRATFVERALRWTRKHKAQTAAMLSMVVAIAALVIGTISTLQQRNIAIENESLAKRNEKLARKNEGLAKKEAIRADKAAGKARDSLKVTVAALTDLVDSVVKEMRNRPDLISLKMKILANAKAKLIQVTELADDSPEVISLKIRAFNAVGQLSYEIGEYKECKSNYENALQLASGLDSAADYQDDLFQARSDIFSGLAAMAFEKHDQENARALYQKAFDNNRDWVAASPDNLKAQMDYAQSADDLADTYVLLNERNWGRAGELHSTAFDIRIKLREKHPEFYDLEYAIANSHMKLGDMEYGQASNRELKDDVRERYNENANRKFKEALKVCEAIVKSNPGEMRGVRLLAAMHERVADTIRGPDAQTHYMQSIRIKEKLSPMLGMDRNFQRDLAISWGRAALYYHQIDDSKTANEYLSKCLSILRETIKRIPDDGGLRVDEMVTLYQIGSINRGDKQLNAFREAVAIGDQLVKEKRIPPDYGLYKAIQAKLKELVKEDK